MKPTKNRIFCLVCGRAKMLFESQSKADNFIRFNAEEIMEENGYAPIRSYYCPFCLGWHVTHKPLITQIQSNFRVFNMNNIHHIA